MENNIDSNDINKIINFLKKKPKLTAGKKCYEFEKKWSNWLGAKYSVFVNSGSSANFLTLAALKYFLKNSKRKEIIVPTIAWNSDIVSVIRNSFIPKFVDINLNNLSMNVDEIIKKINSNTAAVLIAHIQGFNAINKKLLDVLKKKKIFLIEDVCESHGANYLKKKCGTFGLASNFSFYYAHHMTTIEGGMISTNNKKFYDLCYRMKGHGLVRESKFRSTKNYYKKKYPDLNDEFIFSHHGFNFRNNEIGAVLGLNQLKRLNKNIKSRNKNFHLFLKMLDKSKFFVDFDTKGISNYAFPIILLKKNIKYRDKFEKHLTKHKVEFRRGNAGGGNQLRQPYLKNFIKFKSTDFPNTEYVHFYGYYIGNYPDFSKKNIIKLLKILNSF
ncbi:MAG: CDP-4-keto-6-deoxy-D-glucose-3-dehydrase [Candidatus Pelagibacter sp. TMED273]|nr:MAG: CDP-4-keto-6-deoxy-D-glucose-3-dehydrase [Candidatus Pelagibacter sp. TMED273]